MCKLFLLSQIYDQIFLNCRVFKTSSSLAVKIFSSILCIRRGSAKRSFDLAEILSTMIGKRGLSILAIAQNAWRPVVNVGTLSMCLALNSPMLDSETNPSSSFIFFAQSQTSGSECATELALEPGSKAYQLLQACCIRIPFFVSPYNTENLLTYKWRCTNAI